MFCDFCTDKFNIISKADNNGRKRNLSEMRNEHIVTTNDTSNDKNNNENPKKKRRLNDSKAYSSNDTYESISSFRH